MTSVDRIANARTFLFVPGHRAERFEKAAQSGADAVVLDLEDSVPSCDKPAARAAIVAKSATLQRLGVPIVIRINSPRSAEGEEDLAWLSGQHPPAAVMVPKADSAESLARVHARLRGVPTLPLLETAQGYAALPSLGAAAGTLRLAIGHIDFMADTGIRCSEGEPEILPLRFAVCMATRLHGLAPAIDGVTVEIDNPEKLTGDVRRALNLGFGGKLCIHPKQIALVHHAMKPTDCELDWAHKVVAANAAAGGAAVQLDGRMIDLPVVMQARRTLARFGASASQPNSE